MKTRKYKETKSVPVWLAVLLGLIVAGAVVLMFVAPYLPELEKPTKEQVDQTQAIHGLPQGGPEYMYYNN